MKLNIKKTISSFTQERLVPGLESRGGVVREHLSRYEYAKRFVFKKEVLDIACGSGYGSALLKQGGASRVLGIDMSEEAVKYARENYSQDGLEFMQGNAEHIKLNKPVDVIISFETIEHLSYPENFLDETLRLLKPEGIFIVSTPVRFKGTLHSKPLNPFHVREWSEQEFIILLNHYYHNIVIEGQYKFKKRWFPYSGRLQRMLFKFKNPKYLPEIDMYPVRPKSPEYKGFTFMMGYIIAKCSNHTIA